MKKIIAYSFLTIILSSFISDNNPEANTIDFTEKDFTEGIEGPIYDKKTKTLYVVNFQNEGTIGAVCEAPYASTLWTTLPKGSTGNALRIDKKGFMYVADYSGHNILKINLKNKECMVHAHNENMNQPNDIALSKKGFIYASDPSWKNSNGNLWLIKPDGTTVLLENNMGTTNGVELSPDERKLYVNESVQRNVWQYDVQKDGSLSNKKLLIKFDDFGMDGMKCDVAGNLYIARYDKGTVDVISSKGEMIKEIKLKGKKPTNVAFGGEHNKTLYITLQDRGIVEKYLNDIEGK